MQLPTTISLSDTAILNELIAHGITIDDLIASGAYMWGGVTKQPKVRPEAKTTTATTEKNPAAKQRTLI